MLHLNHRTSLISIPSPLTQVFPNTIRSTLGSQHTLMASDETMTLLHLDGDGEDEYEPTTGRDDGDNWSTRESSAAEKKEEEDEVGKRLRALSIDIGRPSPRPLWIEDYSSETEMRGPRRRRAATGRGGRAAACCRERCLERAWETRRCGSPEGGLGCRVLVRPRGGPGRLCMDIQEVKACRDLGLELPCDWTVEIAGEVAVECGGGGSSSPIGNWRISSPGDDPRDIKARLRVWAQAVALASSSGLSA